MPAAASRGSTTTDPADTLAQADTQPGMAKVTPTPAPEPPVDTDGDGTPGVGRA